MFRILSTFYENPASKLMKPEENGSNWSVHAFWVAIDQCYHQDLNDLYILLQFKKINVPEVTNKMIALYGTLPFVKSTVVLVRSTIFQKFQILWSYSSQAIIFSYHICALRHCTQSRNCKVCHRVEKLSFNYVRDAIGKTWISIGSSYPRFFCH